MTTASGPRPPAIRCGGPPASDAPPRPRPRRPARDDAAPRPRRGPDSSAGHRVRLENRLLLPAVGAPRHPDAAIGREAEPLPPLLGRAHRIRHRVVLHVSGDHDALRQERPGRRCAARPPRTAWRRRGSAPGSAQEARAPRRSAGRSDRRAGRWRSSPGCRGRGAAARDWATAPSPCTRGRRGRCCPSRDRSPRQVQRKVAMLGQRAEALADDPGSGLGHRRHDQGEVRIQVPKPRDQRQSP